MVGKERTTTLRVRNTEAQPITLQLRAVDWNQANGEDVYTPSQTLAVSPPVFTLKPGETQTVRVVVEGVTAIRTERAYRLILDQIPESHLKGETGVIVPIRVLLPVFLDAFHGLAPATVLEVPRIAVGRGADGQQHG
jgi:fimbrial chaperone protein